MPATDDEVMEVEDFIEDEKSEMHDVANTEQTLGSIGNEGSSSEKILLESSEGLLLLPTNSSSLDFINLQNLQWQLKAGRYELYTAHTIGSRSSVYLGTRMLWI